MTKSSIIFLCFTGLLTFLLILSVFIFGFFKVEFSSDYNSYNFEFNFKKINLYAFNGNMPEYSYEYIEYKGVPCCAVVLETYYYEDITDISISLSQPYLYAIYDISSTDIDSPVELTNYIYNGGALPLRRANFVTGCIVPIFDLPTTYNVSNGHEVIDNIFDYVYNYDTLPYYYELLFISLDSYLIVDSGQPLLSYSLPEDVTPYAIAKLSSGNIIASSLVVFTYTIKHYDFPSFDYTFDSILEIGPYIRAFFNYIGDLADYFYNLISCFMYTLIPYFWVN